MKSRLLTSSVRTPICATSRPDEKLLPLPRQIDGAGLGMVVVKLPQHVPESRIHLVIRGIVPIRAVVAHDGDGAIELESDQLLAHGASWVGKRSAASRRQDVVDRAG